ncbi:MAG: hypothetical protein E7456_05240 [Ruminococcaceae bacterium]|nr:hypothetical protein [Oscillospiraceae bacterium]
MKIYNWFDLIINSINGISIIVYQLCNYESQFDIPLIICGILLIIQGIRLSMSKERYEEALEENEAKKYRQKKLLNKYGKKIRILQTLPSVILFIAFILHWIFGAQSWTVITLFTVIALYLILTLITTIIEYQFND